MFWFSLMLVVFWCHSTKGKITWPAGQYGLPMPKAGCPNNWFDGRRFHDVGSGNVIDRKVYESLHLGGWISKEGIEQDFCIKTSKDKSQDWPEGRYCILRHDACPKGLSTGSVSWRPGISNFQDSSVNGVRLKNTTINYCCSMRGDIRHAISLPLDKPFYLYTVSGEGCQSVKGATLKEEKVDLDKTTGRYQVKVEGDNPFTSDKNGALTKISYCYYTPGLHEQEHTRNQNSAGGSITIPESQEVEKTLFTGSQLDNKTQSSGLAVAIGVGIACAMIGTASIAVVTKRLMRKKQCDGEDDDDEPKPDDP